MAHREGGTLIMISSASFSLLPLNKVLSLITPYFRGWEITAEGTLLLPEIEKELSELMESYPLILQAHAPLSDINIAGANPHVRECALREINRAIESAGNLGIKVMTIHPGFRTPLYREPDKVREETRKSLKLLEKSALDSGITLALENMPLTSITVGHRPVEMEEMTEGLEIKWCFDVGHANTTDTIDDFLDHVGRFANIHIHDNMGEKDQHLPLGDGNIDWRKVFDSLSSYNGNFVLEMDRGMGDAMKSLDFLRNLGIKV